MPDCIFCKIVAGEVPSDKLYESEEVLVFLDIHPTSPGHTLVIPKKHSSSIFDINMSDWAAVSEAVRLMAIRVTEALNADGINIAMNNREHAGQVVHHPHVHLIPRFKGDGLKLMPHGSYKEGEAAIIAQKIKDTR